jgi:hypothetical protein
MEVAGYDVNDGDEDINDPIGDLDELSRRIEEGETFNDE